MNFSIQYDNNVHNDLKKISEPDKKRIKKSIEKKLFHNPKQFGKPLKNILKNYWSLRVGQYRVVYEIKNEEVIVLVISIAKREIVYENLKKRLL